MTTMIDFYQKVVLITGASSGIGEATARHLAKAGHVVCLGARRHHRVDRIACEINDAGGQAIAIVVDVRQAQSVSNFVESAVQRFGRVDVMINNAGVMPLSRMDALRVSDWDLMIDTNLRGVLYGIAAVLPVMMRQSDGQIINIASTAAHVVRPTAAVYCATKYAVRAVSEGLRQENKHIRVTVISPGLTTSELIESIPDENIKTAVRSMAASSSISASAVAAAIGFAIDQSKDVDVNEILIRPTAQE